jgi:hypothetical protein
MAHIKTLLKLYQAKYGAFVILIIWLSHAHGTYIENSYVVLTDIYNKFRLGYDFNNISVISWRSVLLVEETRGPEENHRPVASH